MNYGSSWKPWRWVGLDLVLTMMKDIPTCTHSQNPIPAAEPLSLKISSHGRFLNLSSRLVPISMRIVISYAMKQGILLWVWLKVNGNWDNNMIRTSQWRESPGTKTENGSFQMLWTPKKMLPKMQKRKRKLLLSDKFLK